jgi:Restriction endonuclease
VLFDIKHDKRNISDNDLISDLNRVAELTSSQIVKQRDYKELGQYGVTTIIRRFGSWNEAIAQAGLSPSVQRYVADEMLFESLCDMWCKLGRQPSYSEVQSPQCQYHVTTYERRFGSWRKALEAFANYANSNKTSIDLIKSESVSAKTTKNGARTADLRLRFQVLMRDNFKCLACGASPATDSNIILHVDHIIPWSKGGETKIDNLQTLCSNCNLGKSNY